MCFSVQSLRRFVVLALLAGSAVSAAGCAARTLYPVEGQVLDQHGKPITELKGCTVEFESVDPKRSAIGTVDAEARFRMTTERPGDGAWLGTHKVLIKRPESEVDERAKPRVILAKYEDNKTSGLRFEVLPQSNTYELKVERVGGKKPKD
jgi:hypothetical protein